MPTGAQIQEVQDALMSAARKLSESPDLLAKLSIFRDHWGLDAYHPPEDVCDTVRNIVSGLVASANALNQPEQ